MNSPWRYMPCSIVREEIDIEALRLRAQHSQAGAVLIFCGDIRNHSQQKQVSYLEYEAYESMALKQISQVVEEAQKKWQMDYYYRNKDTILKKMKDKYRQKKLNLSKTRLTKEIYGE